MSAPVARIVRVALLSSLALNLILGGWLMSRAAWGPRNLPHAQHATLPHLADLRAFRRALPEARQAAVDRSVDRHRPAMRERVGGLFAARRAVRAAMRAEPFDRAALDAAFAQLRQAESEAAESAQTLMGDVFEAATPVERAALADLVPRHARNRERAHHQHPRGEDAPSDRQD